MQGWLRDRRRRLLAALLVLATLAGTVATLLEMSAQARRDRTYASRIAALDKLRHEQDAALWQALAGERRRFDERTVLRRRTQALLEGLPDRQDGIDLRGLKRDWLTYLATQADTAAILADGRGSAARAHARSALAVAAGRVDASVAQAAAWVDREARQQEARGRWGMVLVVGVALAIAGVLLRHSELTRVRLRLAERDEEAASASERRLRALVSHAADVIVVVEPDGTIGFCSPRGHDIFGAPPEALVGRALVDLVPEGVEGPTGAEFLASVRAAGGGPVVGEWRARGERHIEAVAVDRCDDPAVHGFVLTVRDMTARKQLEGVLAHRAAHDPLTDLANRERFAELTAAAVARARAGAGDVAVLFIDLDDFKNVNDTHGHSAGDRLLRVVAGRLRFAVRTQDVPARLGGDEFAVLLGDAAGVSEAHAVAERVLSLFEPPFVIRGMSLAVRASVGVVQLPRGSRNASADELLRRADIAMYTAKQRGKSRVELFDVGMEATMSDRLRLRAELEAALRHDELRLHFQPVVNLQSGQPAGVEALVRWQHPDRGLISPGEFVPLAEETGLVVPMGRWVLFTATASAARWSRRTGIPWPVSVNVSPRQFAASTVGADVRDALRAAALPARQLVVEVTESVLLEDTDDVLAQLHEIAALGVRIALDDFGSGYSSLAYLRRLPLDILKIDRTFVTGLEEPSGAELVAAMIQLAEAVSVTVVAEGIEHASQAAQLRAMGCALGQGFHFARPMPTDVMDRYADGTERAAMLAG